jgi:hypothetical protein
MHAAPTAVVTCDMLQGKLAKCLKSNTYATESLTCMHTAVTAVVMCDRHTCNSAAGQAG